MHVIKGRLHETHRSGRLLNVNIQDTIFIFLKEKTVSTILEMFLMKEKSKFFVVSFTTEQFVRNNFYKLF